MLFNRIQLGHPSVPCADSVTLTDNASTADQGHAFHRAFHAVIRAFHRIYLRCQASFGSLVHFSCTSLHALRNDKMTFYTPIKYTLDCVKLTFGGSYTHTQSSWVRPHGPQITCHCEGFLDLDYRVIIIFRLSTKLDKNQWTSWTGPP